MLVLTTAWLCYNISVKSSKNRNATMCFGEKYIKIQRCLGKMTSKFKNKKSVGIFNWNYKIDYKMAEKMMKEY